MVRVTKKLRYECVVSPGQGQCYGRCSSRLSIGSVAHVENDKKEFTRDVYHLARLGVRLLDSSEGSMLVQSSFESSLVSEVKEKQDMSSKV